MNKLATVQTAAPLPLEQFSAALQKLLADQQFDSVRVQESGGSLVITAQKAPFVLMTLFGHPASRKQAVASVGGAIDAARPAGT